MPPPNDAPDPEEIKRQRDGSQSQYQKQREVVNQPAPNPGTPYATPFPKTTVTNTPMRVIAAPGGNRVSTDAGTGATVALPGTYVVANGVVCATNVIYSGKLDYFAG